MVCSAGARALGEAADGVAAPAETTLLARQSGQGLGPLPAWWPAVAAHIKNESVLRRKPVHRTKRQRLTGKAQKQLDRNIRRKQTTTQVESAKKRNVTRERLTISMKASGTGISSDKNDNLGIHLRSLLCHVSSFKPGKGQHNPCQPYATVFVSSWARHCTSIALVIESLNVGRCDVDL